MKLMKTEDAVGQVLCHDITQIIKGVTKDAVFRKGHIITEGDIPVLLSVGKDNVYIWENDETTLHEDEAADILRAICQGEHMHASPAKEGKIELIADVDGLLLVDLEHLRAVNSLGEMMIATRSSGFVVKKGDKLCGTRIIPLVIEKEKMEAAKQAAGGKPLLQLYPLKAKRYGIVTTGNEVYYGRIQDTFTQVIQEKLTEYGCEMVAHEVLNDDHEKITAAIQKMLAEGCEMVFCTGGMSVDPDDKTPLAIKNTGASIVSYGAPVLPGAMFLMAYAQDGRPICGLPGCVMYANRTIFDLVLPYLLADVPVTADYLARLGNGGLCLNCKVCHFPNCGFGKGV
ncbi:MAG: molybdopterin-binding protein [Clostridiales bacterium]|nr:molybdopterin-binding protein [Clostridiales bacterium]